MNFRLTPEQELLVESADRLVRNKFGEVTRRADIPSGVPRHYLRILADSGFAGLALAEGLGGQGGQLVDAVLVIETMASVNPPAGDALQALNFGAVQQLAHLGSTYLKEAYLARCLTGELLTAIAMSEPDAGSAVGRLRTRAERRNDSIVINGQKLFTTHGADADFFVVWARFGDTTDSIGAIVVDRSAPGFTIDATNTFMSGEAYGVLSFDNCSVPTSNVLIDRDGLRLMLPVFNVERLGNAARSLALGEAAFRIALDHLRTREQFGRRLADFQGLQWRVAEMALKLESARVLLYRAASNADSGLPSGYDTAVAKLACNRAGFEVSDAALQCLGGYGYDAESVVGYLFHRTRGWMIAGGTVEQMLNRVARILLDEQAGPAATAVAKRIESHRR